MRQLQFAPEIPFALQAGPSIGVCSIRHEVRARVDEGRAWLAPLRFGGATFLLAGRRPSRLFLALPHADIEADHSVLIARAHHGDIAIEVILALNDLLRTLRDVRAVSKRKVVGELLLDSDLRASGGGVGLSGQPLRVNFYPAD